MGWSRSERREERRKGNGRGRAGRDLMEVEGRRRGGGGGSLSLLGYGNRSGFDRYVAKYRPDPSRHVDVK